MIASFSTGGPAMLVLCAGELAQGSRRGDLYILSVGVDSALNSSDGYSARADDIYARDALNVRRAFVGAEPWFETVHSRSYVASQATPRAVREAFHRLSLEMRAKDFAVISFSAHGDVDPERGFHLDLAQPSGVAAIAQGSDYRLWGSEINAGLALIAGRTLVLLDACRAGALLTNVDDHALQRCAYLLSCSAEEFSAGQNERADRPHGYFVIALCEALAGLADKNVDGRISLAEVEAYVPARARAFYVGQKAVVHRSSSFGEITLGYLASPHTVQQLWTPRSWRNPFGMPDVPEPDAADVQKFAASLRWDTATDETNATPWTEIVVSEAADAIEGTWSSRWNMEKPARPWQTGTATVRTIGDRVYVFYQDKVPYLIDLRRSGPDLLVGRYVNLAKPSDTAPWVGRIVGPDRIDGYWPNGRWDFRRRFSVARVSESLSESR